MSTGAGTAEPVDLMPGKSAQKKAREPKPQSILPRPKSLAMQPLAFFRWMGKFTDEQKGRATLSVYRDWPVIDKKLTDPTCKRPRLIAWFGDGNPMPIENPNEWEEFFLKNPEWGGSGEYKCICNEVGLHGAIALTHFKFKDAEYPPIVDPAIVIQGHPENKGYLDGLRARGIPIPGESTNEEKDMNVAAQLVDTVTKTNERLMDRIEELQEESGEDTPIEESVTEKAIEKGFDMMANATGKAMEVLTEQNKKLAAVTSPDPLELLTKAKQLFSPGQGDSTMQIFGLFMQNQRESLATVQTMHKDTLEFMEKMEAKREQAVTVAQQQPLPNGLSSTIDSMRQIKEVAELFGMSAPNRPVERDENPAPPAVPWYEPWVKNPPLMFAGIALLQSTLAAVFNRNAPQKPVTEVIKDAMESGQRLMQGAAGTTPQPEQANPQQQALQFLQFIEPLFLAHFYDSDQRGLNGFTFAEVFMTMTQTAAGVATFVPDGPATPAGMQQYQAIKGAGLEKFDRLIQSYPPIWNMVQGDRPRYQKFLTEFFTFTEEAERRAGAAA